ncbi:MAG: Fe-S-containing hydro-lyase [Oscillospiraceae bacterium]|nr:Fe-S-containing hydro-lyase [Oscillospiraceae bacterium]
MTELNTSELKEKAKTLRAGDKVLLSGTVYTSRDAAHKRIKALLDSGETLPYALDGAAVYYAGPTGAKDGMVIGSCGPTTSSRMDVYSPEFLDRGLSAMIGKGERSEAVCEAIQRNGAVYFCAIGGAGALACKCITECEVIAFEDLGCESVKRLMFRDFPLIVAIDSAGGNIFKSGRAQYSR